MLNWIIWILVKPFNCVQAKNEPGLLKNVIFKMSLEMIYLIYV